MTIEVHTIEVHTKDCTALADAELAEMADICAGGPAGFDVGFLSKQRDDWVLVTQADDGGSRAGFALITLERIGGTPSMLIGVASVKRSARSREVLRLVLADGYRRALLAFPDEDVLVAARITGPEGFAAFDGLEDVVPRPGHKATGEERAWGRRLAKRFGAEGKLDDRRFVLAGDGPPVGILDYWQEPAEAEEPNTQFFENLDPGRGECLVAFGWAMAEDLASGALFG
ncbi:MAG: hypothetical protein ACYDH5_06040 [Acidimicrobiales bacterium]